MTSRFESVRLPILPIDTGRYGSPEMRRIFEEENKLQRWLDVEAAGAEAQAFFGDIPKRGAEGIARKSNTKNVAFVNGKRNEKENRHDLMSTGEAPSQASSAP